MTTPCSSVNELEELAQRFKSWREQYRSRHFPQSYWVHAVTLAKRHSVDVVAKQIGISSNYLHFKLKQKSQNPVRSKVVSHDSQFVEVSVKETLTFAQPVTMRLRNSKGLEMELSFSGSPQQIFPLIKDLVEQEQRCSK